MSVNYTIAINVSKMQIDIIGIHYYVSKMTKNIAKNIPMKISISKESCVMAISGIAP